MNLSLKNLERYLKKRLISKRSTTHSLKKRSEKFSDLYPQYRIGLGTYGVPIVFSDNQTTTLKIGSFCSISDNVRIFLGGMHRTDWVTSYPFPAFCSEAKHIKDYSISKGDVVIGSDVWLCANSIILSGVTIGHGAVVANGSIVTKDVEPYAIVAGNPAKTIRYRFDKNICDRLLATSWWDWPEHKILDNVELLCNGDIEEFLTSAGF